jgi:SAM-dependent methyltransferase
LADRMARYYDKRAPVYDRVYAYPERQSDLRVLERIVASLFSNRRVLELAAGTGYWTQFAAANAHSVLATDVNQATLDELLSRRIQGNVSTLVSDAFDLKGVSGQFDGAFAGCWFSHVGVEARGRWLDGLHDKLSPGSRVLLLDNSLEQTVRLPIIETDDIGNTYQIRTTDDGETHKVIKNFPVAEELMGLVGDYDAKFDLMTHYWTLSYTLPAP